MADFAATHVLPLQIVCLAIATAIFGPLVLSRSVRACAWASARAKLLHGELCECLYCEQLVELQRRIAQLEREMAMRSESPVRATGPQPAAESGVNRG